MMLKVTMTISLNCGKIDLKYYVLEACLAQSHLLSLGASNLRKTVKKTHMNRTSNIPLVTDNSLTYNTVSHIQYWPNLQFLFIAPNLLNQDARSLRIKSISYV